MSQHVDQGMTLTMLGAGRGVQHTHGGLEPTISIKCSDRGAIPIDLGDQSSP